MFDSLRLSAVCLLAASLAATLGGCSDGAGEAAPDVAVADVEDAAADIVVDIQRDIDVVSDVREDIGPTAEELVCLPCTVALDCGENNFCLEGYPDGNSYCAFNCRGGDADTCPEGTTCRDLDTLGVQSACVPDDLSLCPCVGVECADDEVCDPTEGACITPRGLCEECTMPQQCGGPDDYCLSFPLTGGRAESACATACSTDTDCGDGYNCLPVNLGGGETADLCIPEILTCTDRCVGVTCEEDFRCNPLDGRCNPQGQICERCSTDAECGGESDRCLGLVGNACTTNRDCATGETCVEDPDTGEQVCRGGYCGAACNPQQGLASTCPEQTVCFRVSEDPTDGQCLPLRLSCVDRCSDVECADGFNCDDVTGECVRSTADYCNPCDSTPSCGDYDDECVTLMGERRCLPSCDGDNICPLGFQCRLNLNGSRFCVPANREAACLDCTDQDCPSADACYALGGACLPEPLACGEGGTACAEGEVCSEAERRCVPLGLPCTLDSAFFYCEASLFGCTAATDELVGSCERSCRSVGICDGARPYCVNLHGTLTDVCVSDNTGGADTCARLMPIQEAIGQPCTVVDDPTDPAICPSATTELCLEGVDANVPGFCTRACDVDEDCGTGQCQRFDDASYCVPAQCACLLDPVLADGEADLVGDLLADAGTSRCGLVWTLVQRRLVSSALAAESAYASGLAASVVGDPLQLATAMQAELASVASSESAQQAALRALDIASAAWRLPIEAERVPDIAREEGALFNALREFSLAVGGGTLSTEDADALARVPLDTQVAIAELLASLSELIDLHREQFAPLVGRAGTLSFDNLASLFLPGETPLSFADERVRGTMTGVAVRQALLLISARAVQALARIPANLATSETPLDVRLDTPYGLVIISAGSNDIWDFRSAPALLVDLDGDDTYLGSYAANAGLEQPFAIVLDAGGSDLYGYAEVPTDADPVGYPADDAGRAAPDGDGNGAVSRSFVRSQGAGFLGVGALVDLGSGEDTYAALRFSQGFGLAGLGVLIDQQARVSLRLEAAGQGGGLGGIGIASLGDAVVDMRAFHLAQGAAGPGGVGVLAAGGGPGRYTMESPSEALYAAPFVLSPGNVSVGQGASVGVREGDGAAGYPVGGGVGVLVERGGADHYSAGILAQGAATRLGLGVLYDASGDDTYDAQELSMGAGLANGLGLLRDLAGNDGFGYTHDGVDRVEGRRATRSAAFGEDLGAGILWDASGNDAHHQGQFSLGLGRINGFALFADASGDDVYNVDANESLGEATLTIFGSEPDNNPRRALGTFGFFLDGGGRDEYVRPDLLNPPLGEERRWLQTSRDEAGLPVFGGGVDAQGGLPL